MESEKTNDTINTEARYNMYSSTDMNGIKINTKKNLDNIDLSDDNMNLSSLIKEMDGGSSSDEISLSDSLDEFEDMLLINNNTDRVYESIFRTSLY